MTRTVHVWTADFASEQVARFYGNAHPEDVEEAGGAAVGLTLRGDLGWEYFDTDFLEIIFGSEAADDRIDWAYLASMVGEPNAAACERVTAQPANTLILVDEQASGGFSAVYGSTPVARYCGAFDALPYR